MSCVCLDKVEVSGEYKLSSGKITPSDEDKISSGSLQSGPLRRILSVSILGVVSKMCTVAAFGDGDEGLVEGLKISQGSAVVDRHVCAVDAV